MKKNGMRPVPPGEILNEEFLKPLGMTANALAKAIGVPPNRITGILKGERGITDRFHGTYPPNINEGTHPISVKGPTQYQVVPVVF